MVGKRYSVQRSGKNIMDSLHINDIFDCSVCFERLNETCKVLPCQHTFCKSCLRAIVASRQELRCPECRSLVTEDIDKLPGNITLIRLLEGLKHSERKTNTTPPPNSKIPFDEPCARAIFSYEPREAGDLSLKRGDLVVLVQKVDDNWYIGELSGKQGYLPANFVEVINPLPKFNEAEKPLARGLYDFEEEDEDGLLQFKQGEILSVLRRVDVNWCEGEIAERRGIFPLNFVQLNHSASELIKLTRSPEPIRQTRQKPNIPVRLLGARLNRKRTQPHKPVKRSRSIPRDNPENLRRRIRDFGQSEVAPNRSSVLDQINRHSIEVTSTEPSSDIISRGDAVALPLRAADVSVRRRLPNDSIENDKPRSSSNRSSPTELQARGESSLDLYIALYNYRPQKSDELELCSGEHYKVLEKGDDGWFRGFAVLRRQKVGHFPGNYVRPISGQNSNTTDVSLFRRRRNRCSPNPAESNELVLPRPRPFSDISNESNQDSEFSPPLTPPLVGAKPPKHGLLRRLSIGKKKDRNNTQTTQQNIQNDRVNQQTDAATGPSLKSSRSTQSSRTRMDGRQGSRTHSVIKEKYRVTANYPPHNPLELELKCGDIVYVTKKQNDGWYHGTLERNGKVGFFPKSFVQKI